MSIEDVKATIQRGSQAARDGIDTLRKAEADAVKAKSLARHTLAGSQHDDVNEGLALLDSIDGEVERTIRRFNGAIDHADAYLAELG